MILTNIMASLALFAVIFVFILGGWLIFMFWWTDKIQPKLEIHRGNLLKHKEHLLKYKIKKYETRKLIKNKFKIPLVKVRGKNG